MPLPEAVANPRPLQAQCGPPLLPRVGGGSRPQVLGVFAEAEALFIVHRRSPSCQILPAPSVSVRCSDGEYRQCWEGGDVGWERLHRYHCVPQEGGVGGQPAPLGLRGGRSGSGGAGGCSEQVEGTPWPLLQWEGSQHHPHPVFSPPPLAQHPEGAGWAGGHSRGGHLCPAQLSPFPLGKSWLPACPSSRVCSHIFPKHRGLCCPLPHASSAWGSPASPRSPGPACLVP